MKAISLKTQGLTINVSESVSKVGSFLKTHSVTLLVISTAAVYTGIIFGSDILTYTAALAALGAVSLALSATKGGAK